MARSRDAGYVSAFEVGVANTEIKDESYKSHSVSRMRTRDRGYISKTTIAGFIDESFEPIATTTVGSGGSSSITFSSIPSTYKHLQIRGISKQSATTTGFPNVGAYFNSDTTYTNYISHYVNGNGSAVSAGNVQASGYYAYSFNTTTSNSGYANIFSVMVMDILDYASTNKNKTIRTLGGQDANGSGEVVLTSGLWMNSSTAINAVTFTLPGGGNFSEYSSFALYGIKG